MLSGCEDVGWKAGNSFKESVGMLGSTDFELTRATTQLELAEEERDEVELELERARTRLSSEKRFLYFLLMSTSTSSCVLTFTARSTITTRRRTERPSRIAAQIATLYSVH